MEHVGFVMEQVKKPKYFLHINVSCVREQVSVDSAKAQGYVSSVTVREKSNAKHATAQASRCIRGNNKWQS